METLYAVLAIILAYLLGSVPMGVIVSRHHGVDIQKVGSGNIGGTNVIRTLGWGPGLLVGFFDVFKGALAVLIARELGFEGPVLGAVALAAILGHDYSVFLRFKGGKGVATTFGTLLAVDPILTLLAAFMALATIAFSRYVSVGSLVGGMAFVVLAVAMAKPVWFVVLSLTVAGLIFYTHRENLSRLQAGNERRIGVKEKSPELNQKSR